MLTPQTDTEGMPSLVLRGAIEGVDLERFGGALEQITQAPRSSVLIDLTGVSSWSLLAQAMVLSTARQVTRSGGQLVLYGPSEALRQQSQAMDIFGRVTTRHRLVESPSARPMRTSKAVALLVVDVRRVLMLRPAGANRLCLPGGSVDRAERPRDALLRHAGRQLDITLDRSSIRECMTIRSVTDDDSGRRLRETCFQSGFAGSPVTPAASADLSWVSSDVTEPLTPAAREVLTILKRADYVD